MELNQLLVELFGRVTEHVHEAVDGLDVDALVTPPADGVNPVGWLVWHLTRIQDYHIAEHPPAGSVVGDGRLAGSIRIGR